MSVAVVVPLFNGRPWIGDALRSVAEQSLVPDEVVVVDDGSTDDSAVIARTFAGVRVVPGAAKGGAAARNRGVRLTSAARVAFLDQDDLWHRDHLRVLNAALDDDADAPAAVGSYGSFSGEHRPRLQAQPRKPAPLDVWARFPLTCPIHTPSTVLVRRTALDAAGGFDESLGGIADYHLWLRLSADRPLVQLAARTVGRRMHGDSELTDLRNAAFDYLALHQRAAHAATHGEREQRVRRCRAFDAAADMARAVADADPERAAQAARALESLVADESDAYVEGVFDRLVWILCNDCRRRRSDLLTSFDAVWPADATRTRRALTSARKVWRHALRRRVRRSRGVLRWLRPSLRL